MITEEQKSTMAADLAADHGLQLKLRRTEMRLTIKQLSELTGITPAAISLIEQGKTDVKMSTLAVLRSALACEISITKVSLDASEYEPMQYEPD